MVSKLFSRFEKRFLLCAYSISLVLNTFFKRENNLETKFNSQANRTRKDWNQTCWPVHFKGENFHQTHLTEIQVCWWNIKLFYKLFESIYLINCSRPEFPEGFPGNITPGVLFKGQGWIQTTNKNLPRGRFCRWVW